MNSDHYLVADSTKTGAETGLTKTMSLAMMITDGKTL